MGSQIALELQVYIPNLGYHFLGLYSSQVDFARIEIDAELFESQVVIPIVVRMKCFDSAGLNLQFEAHLRIAHKITV